MATPTDFVPRRESELNNFVHTFDTRITANPTQVGLTATLALAFHTLVLAWDAAYAVTKDRSTRSRGAVIVKDEAKFAMVKNLRELARIVQAFPGTTNLMRDELGLTVPSERQSQPAPASAPRLLITKVVRNTVSVELRDSQDVSRLRPDFAKSANVFSYIGTNPPLTPEAWFFQGGSTRTRFDVSFDPSLPMGTVVYLTACWKNERDMAGIACEPVPVTLLGTGALPIAQRKGDGESLAIAA